MLFEVGQEIGIGEMEQARSVIRHCVCFAWDEESAGAVAVEALVRAGFGAQQRGRPRLGDRSFVMATEGRCVVGAVLDGAVGQVEDAAHDAWLPLTRRLLEVAVSDCSVRVVDRNQAPPDVQGELEAPDMGVCGFVEECTSQAQS